MKSQNLVEEKLSSIAIGQAAVSRDLIKRQSGILETIQ
jgi:hypothetical protein